MKNHKELFIIVIIQIIAIFIAFNHEILQPNMYALYDMHDGLKNYFTYYSYILDNKISSINLFRQMNYPFGDIYLYTDNTPILSISLKFLTLFGFDFTDSAFLIHHLFFISGIVASSIISYFILRKFLNNQILIVIASFSLPWICPQYLKINGYFALSFSAILLWVALLLINQLEAIENTNKKFYYNIVLLQLITLFASIFVHLYYLPTLAITILSFWFFHLISERNKLSITVFLHSVLLVLISFTLFYILILKIDVYKDFRESGATGYDWINWKLRWENLFYKYDYLQISFIYRYKKYLGIETNAYLGSFALYGTLLAPFFLYFFKNKSKAHKGLGYLFLSSLILLIISFGEHIPFGDTDKTFTNILNPFFYIHKVSPIVTQFRCLGRFGWLFFWAYNFIILFILDRLISVTSGRILKVCLYLLILLCLTDAINTIQMKSKDLHFNMLKNTEKMEDMIKLTNQVDFSRYQAILPLPYYHVGYENADYIIDPDEEHCTRTYQLSLLTKLPLMSSRMSRTPGNLTKGLYGIFTEKQIQEIVLSKLNEKPILVYVDWVKIHNGYKPINANALSIYNQYIPFLESNEFKTISKYYQYELLEWIKCK